MRKREALFSVVKHARFTVTAAVALTILYTRSPQVLWTAAGGVACSFVAKLLKTVIRQPRPLVVIEKKVSTPSRTSPPHIITRIFSSHTHGMPSSHTQVTAYFATYFTLYYLVPSSHNPHPPTKPSTAASGILVGLNVFGLIVAWSRVYLGKHTVAQVGVGWVVGTVFAAGWYWAWRCGGAAELVEGWCRIVGFVQ
ncbi:hypothetical protein SpCBS45565_g06357 [Spizellomyces sp. 'palustris']|nr:hypothetical protein SpCBS45565_g06357 [Spizellomyces sp. 'palustris']